MKVNTVSVYYIGKYKTNLESNTKYIQNNIKNFNIIKNKHQQELLYETYQKFFDSSLVEKLIKKQIRLYQHPFLYKKIEETNDKVILKAINLTHSPEDIKINNDIVQKIKVGSYWKDGKEIPQYAPKASCIIEMTKEEYNEMIQDITNDTEEIKKLGGKDNLEKITRKIENEWDTNPSYDYMNYLKTTVTNYYDKYEKDLDTQQENINIYKPDEE